MDRSSNNRAVEKRMKDRLATDRARLQIGRISSFGLMEMSRQRLRPGMLEASTTECPHCHGSGLVRSDESLALTILRDVEEEGVKGRSAVVSIKAPVSIANFLLNHKRDRIMSIEDRYNLRVVVEGDPHLIQPNYTLEKMKEDEAPESLRRVTRPAAVKMETSYLDDDIEVQETEAADADTRGNAPASPSKSSDDSENDRPSRRGKRGGRGGKKSNDADPLRVIDLDSADDQQGEKPFQYGAKPAEKSDGENDDERRGRRGQRGGRKRNERTERGKLGNRELAEAAATSMLSGRDALDDALPDLFSEPRVPSPKQTTAAAKPAPKKAVEPVAAPAPTPVEIPATPEPAEAKKQSEPAPIVVEEPKPEPTPEPTPPQVQQDKPAPEPAEAPVDALSVKAPPTPPRDEPKKRGWWSRK